MDIASSNSGHFLPELVAAAVAGNGAAWNTLVERFSPLVTAVTRRYRLTDGDADDVAATVWLRLVEQLANVREARALPKWIVTTTRNEALRVLAARRRVEVVDPMADSRLDKAESIDVATDLLLTERRHAVNEGLAELRAPHRELLLLTFADTPISYREISQRLGMPAGSIGPTRARCLKKLKNTAPVRALAS
jgi:RNA polymerase sigma factor (sigma-70 family)